MDDVKRIFDGYDVGIRYADDAVGTAAEPARRPRRARRHDADPHLSDHGEAFGELGVYADHQAADEATAHIPSSFVARRRPPGWTARCTTTSMWPPRSLQLAGVATPRPGTGTRVPVRRLVDARAPKPDATTWCRRRARGPASAACASGTTSTCRRCTTATTPGRDEMLFDLATDPHEQAQPGRHRAPRRPRRRGTAERLAGRSADPLTRRRRPSAGRHGRGWPIPCSWASPEVSGPAAQYRPKHLGGRPCRAIPSRRCLIGGPASMGCVRSRWLWSLRSTLAICPVASWVSTCSSSSPAG